MTPAQLKAAREFLGLSAEEFARLFGAGSGRTVRGWEAGERNGKPTAVPETLAILVNLVVECAEARERIIGRRSHN